MSFPNKHIEKAIELSQIGYTMDEIAAKYTKPGKRTVTKRMVQVAFAREGYYVNEFITQTFGKEVYELKAEGHSVASIARMYDNVSENKVRHQIKAYSEYLKGER